MQTYLSCENIPSRPRSVALGLFDGLHPAHRRVILSATMDIDDDTIVSVYTFDPSPHVHRTHGPYESISSMMLQT